jgi:carbonic anhydrase
MLSWLSRPRSEDLGRTCLLIGCSDAPRRLPGEPAAGWTGVMRIASHGNVVPPHGAAPQPVATIIAHAVEHRGVQDIVVCGHAGCEAMRGLLLPADLAPSEAHRAWSAHAAGTRALLRAHYMHLDGEALWDVAVQEHVLLQLEHLLTHPAVREAVDDGRIRIHGWLHDERRQLLLAYDPTLEQFEPVTTPLPPRPSQRGGLHRD